MSPQLIQIAECLNEANTREIKIARCLAESLKRIQELEQSKTEVSQQAKEAEKRFSAALHDLAEQLTKTGEETTSIAQHLSNQINTEKEQFSTELTNVVDQLTKTSEQAKVEFGYKVDEIALKLAELPAQMAAFKAEFAIPSVQADAPKSFNPRGAYENGEKYQPFDYVSANGSSYIALVENPTEPPSKKSKQWMLVAAKGASGSGGIISASEVVGLGTAAFRDVGQAAGNVPVMSANGTLSIGDNASGSYISTVRLYDSANDAYLSISAADSELSLNNFTLRNTGGNNVSFLNTNVIAPRSFEFPDKDGTIALISDVGDRYLTSSTTSLLIGNGAKTLTVGTGLAYTPTQDITIVNDAAHHMHAAVTSYNSTTGALVVDVNSHTGTGTFTSWTVNVGGIGAGAIPSGGTTGQVLAKVSSTDYDDAWVTPTVAVGGITGLGTGVATALAISVGSAGAPVVNGGVGGTPSSITLTNATGYPEATTTTAGTVPGIGAGNLYAPTSSNVALISQVSGVGRANISELFSDMMGPVSGFYQTDGFLWFANTASSGAVANIAEEAGHSGIIRYSTGAVSAAGRAGIDNGLNGQGVFKTGDGSLFMEWLIRIPTLSNVTDTFIVTTCGSTGAASTANEAIYIRYTHSENSGAFTLACRASASETTSSTGITVVANTWYKVAILVNAAGTSVQAYINGTASGTAITTNIPSAFTRIGGGIFKSLGTAARTLDIDYTYYLKTFTTAR